MRVSFYSLGCKANQADNRKICSRLAKLGWYIVPFGKKADYCVVNTCAVTHGAEQRSRQMLRAAQKNSGTIIASGCFINKIPEIKYYFKTADQTVAFFIKIHTAAAAPMPRPATRAFVRIQDGCDFMCSYCLIKNMRGKSESKPCQEIIKEIKEKQKRGYKEIVLTGINILQYNHGNSNLSGLIQLILDQTNLPRIRLGSIDPRLITDEFVELFKNPRLGQGFGGQARLMPHLHLSLQSGSNKILELMNRSYSAERYLGIIYRFRVLNPLFSFTTDVITGFPDESEKDHCATLDLIKQAQFTKVHVFPYSDRPGTESENLLPKIDESTKKIRHQQIQKTATQAKNKWLKNYRGKTLNVLFEQRSHNFWEGYTPYYFKIKKADNRILDNRIMGVEIKKENII